MSESKENISVPVDQLYREAIGTPYTDCLTGLVNHGFFYLTLDRDVNRSNRDGTPFTLGVINVDSFSAFNKARGRIEGDRILREIAGCIKKNIRNGDLAARYAEDVFSIIFTGVNSNAAFHAAERIRSDVESLMGRDVTVSIGLADYPDGAVTAEGLYRKASEALKKAQVKGKNCIELYARDSSPVTEDPGRVLIVDDLPKNLKLIEAMLYPLKCEVYKAESGMKALEILRKFDIDLVLLDVMMPEMDGYETCRRIKTRAATRMVPVVMVTALDDTESKIRGIDAGADDFITKPPHPAELLARTRSLVRLKQLYRSLASIESVLFSMAKAVEAKDKYTQGHIERVANLSRVMGHEMGLPPEDLKALEYGGVLHDIGKIGIPNEILNKPGRLDEKERKLMETHPLLGYQIGMPLEKNLGLALQVIRYHHEKLDGSGYPDGLKGENIPLVARIVGVVDIYDALITDRPYRKGMPREKAYAILTEEAAEGKLDQNIVSRLIAFCKTQNMDAVEKLKIS